MTNKGLMAAILAFGALGEIGGTSFTSTTPPPKTYRNPTKARQTKAQKKAAKKMAQRQRKEQS